MNHLATVPASDARIIRMGRTQTLDNGGVRFSYPGVTLKFRFYGNKAVLSAVSTSANSYIEIIADGKPPHPIRLAQGDNAITLIDTDSVAEHEVEIIHRSETWQGIVTVKQITISSGDILDPPALPSRRLLVIGDSVTCGEAIDRDPGNSCEKNSSWWNPRLSYGMLLARALDAQVHLVCYGGRGLIRSWEGKSDTLNVPQFFDLTIPDESAPVVWDHSAYDPDLILISLGTNDFSLGIGPLPNEEEFVSRYVRFINKILTLHPNARLVITEGAIVNDEADPQRPQKTVLRRYLNETAKRVGSDRLFVVPSEHYPGDHCDAHPTREQHQAMSEDLAPLLKNIMQW